MCTVSWCRRNGERGYSVFFNRDEQRARACGESPTIRTATNGVRWCGPRDPCGGGTWIWTNDHGLSACVLNHYPKESSAAAAAPFRSRGLLLADLAGARAESEFEGWLRAALTATPYQACFVLLFGAGGDPLLWRWDGPGSFLCAEPAIVPLTTSSFAADEVRAERLRRFAQMAADGSARIDACLLERFHRDRAGSTGAHAVCMSRSDARTHSFSRIDVGESVSTFHYAPRDGEGGFTDPVARTLELNLTR